MDGWAVKDWLQLAGVLAALAAAWWVNRNSRRAVQVQEGASDLNRMVQLRKDLTEAEGQVDRLNDTVSDLRRKLRVVTAEAEAAYAELEVVRRTIWRPGMSIDRLREFIGPPGVGPPAEGDGAAGPT